MCGRVTAQIKVITLAMDDGSAARSQGILVLGDVAVIID